MMLGAVLDDGECFGRREVLQVEVGRFARRERGRGKLLGKLLAYSPALSRSLHLNYYMQLGFKERSLFLGESYSCEQLMG